MDKIKTIDSIDLHRIAYKLAVGIVKKHPHYDFDELLGAIKEQLPVTDIKYWTLDYIRAEHRRLAGASPKTSAAD